MPVTSIFVPDSPPPLLLPLSATSLASPPILSGGGIQTGSSAVRIRQGAARPDTRCLGLPVVGERLVRAGTTAQIIGSTSCTLDSGGGEDGEDGGHKGHPPHSTIPKQDKEFFSWQLADKLAVGMGAGKAG